MWKICWILTTFENVHLKCTPPPRSLFEISKYATGSDGTVWCVCAVFSTTTSFVIVLYTVFTIVTLVHHNNLFDCSPPTKLTIGSGFIAHNFCTQHLCTFSVSMISKQVLKIYFCKLSSIFMNLWTLWWLSLVCHRASLHEVKVYAVSVILFVRPSPVCHTFSKWLNQKHFHHIIK